MKLNQAKKLKRQSMLQEQAALGQTGQPTVNSEHEDASSEGAEISPANSALIIEPPTVGSIIIKPRETSVTEVVRPEKPKEAPRSHKKRKREPESETVDVMIDAALLVPSEFDTKPVQKKLKLGPPIVIPAAAVIEKVDADLVSEAVHTAEDTVALRLASATQSASNIEDSVSAKPEPHVTPTIAAPSEEEPQPKPSIVDLASQPSPEPVKRPILELKPPKTAANRSTRIKKSATPVPDSATTANDSGRPRSRSGAILSLTFNGNKTKAASAEPPARRASGRRASNVSLPSTQASPKKKNKEEDEAESGTSTRRVRRPAPGLLASSDTSQREGLQVILGKRKGAPSRKPSKPLVLTTSSATNTTTNANKRQKSVSAATPTITVGETDNEEYYNGERIDPDEPRYCICDRVSFGTMVACENDACEKEWFHLECVGLEDIPPRRTKWYCPECRILLRVTEYGGPRDSGGEGKFESTRQSGRVHGHK